MKTDLGAPGTVELVGGTLSQRGSYEGRLTGVLPEEEDPGGRVPWRWRERL